MSGKLQVVVGGQFGSEGKGAVTGYLARKEHEQGRPLMAIRVAGPNAGHTVIGDDGREWKLRQVPVAAVTDPDALLGIAAGSEIDIAVLSDEMSNLDSHGYNVTDRLAVDSAATVIEPHHANAEARLVAGIGSTGKGIGAARADRIMRTATRWADVSSSRTDTAQLAAQHLVDGGTVQVECAQGYGLGLHTGYYPHCTSSDCRAVDFLAMAGISPWQYGVEFLEIWVVFRTLPIRVAGPSGPLHNELTWAELSQRSGGHITEEHTTVTGKVRRIGEWDNPLARAALAANGAHPRGGRSPVRVALTFLDYDQPSLANLVGPDLGRVDLLNPLHKYEDALGHPIHLVGTGPNHLTEVR